MLRRYTLGEGETHRTVANALSSMDASKGRLAERIDEAFRVKPVTEDLALVNRQTTPQRGRVAQPRR